MIDTSDVFLTQEDIDSLLEAMQSRDRDNSDGIMEGANVGEEKKPLGIKAREELLNAKMDEVIELNKKLDAILEIVEETENKMNSRMNDETMNEIDCYSAYEKIKELLK